MRKYGSFIQQLGREANLIELMLVGEHNQYNLLRYIYNKYRRRRLVTANLLAFLSSLFCLFVSRRYALRLSSCGVPWPIQCFLMKPLF